jgi:hypothetical protein
LNHCLISSVSRFIFVVLILKGRKMGQSPSSGTPAPQPPPPTLRKGQPQQKKLVSLLPFEVASSQISYYHSQVGFQCYFVLEQVSSKAEDEQVPGAVQWDQYRLRCELENSHLTQSFTTITDHTWQTDLIEIHRLSLASAINPSCVSLGFKLSGLQCPHMTHDHCDAATSPNLFIKVPAYAQHDVQIPICERKQQPTKSSSTTGSYYCPKSLDFSVAWSMMNGSSPQQLIQWMLEEKRFLFCVSLMFDLVYTISTHPDHVFTVVKL